MNQPPQDYDFSDLSPVGCLEEPFEGLPRLQPGTAYLLHQDPPGGQKFTVYVVSAGYSIGGTVASSEKTYLVPNPGYGWDGWVIDESTMSGFILCPQQKLRPVLNSRDPRDHQAVGYFLLENGLSPIGNLDEVASSDQLPPLQAGTSYLLFQESRESPQLAVYVIEAGTDIGGFKTPEGNQLHFFASDEGI